MRAAQSERSEIFFDGAKTSSPFETPRAWRYDTPESFEWIAVRLGFQPGRGLFSGDEALCRLASSCNSLAPTQCSRSPLLAQICLGLHAYSLA